MRLVLAVLLLMLTRPVAASGTLCMFDPPRHSPVPTVEFLGYSEIGPVQVLGPNGPHSLRAGSWRVRQFSESSSRIAFEYTNPHDPAEPPSFRLHGRGKRVVLNVAGKRYIGELRCDQW